MEFKQLLLVGGLLSLAWLVIDRLTALLLSSTLLPPPLKNAVLFRIMKGLHGLTAFTVSTTALLTHALGGTVSAHYTDMVYLITGTFYIYDTLKGLAIGITSKWSVGHHVMTLVLMLAVWVSSDPYLIFRAIVVMEVSNGPQHARQIVRMAGMRYTKLFQMTEKVFIYSFLAARVIVWPLVYGYVVLYVKNFHPLAHLGSTFLVIHSGYFSCQVYKKLKARWEEEKEVQEKGINYSWFIQDKKRLSELSFYQRKETFDI